MDNAAEASDGYVPSGDAQTRARPGASGKQDWPNPFVLMDDIVDKLKILDYEKKFCKLRNIPPFHRVYFAISGPNPPEQFYHFACCVAWLLSLIGETKGFNAPSFHDDPNEVSTNIVEAVKALGIPTDFAPTKLRQGSGEAVCYVLGKLTDLALKRQNFVIHKPVHPQVSGADGLHASGIENGDAPAEESDLLDEAIEEDLEGDDTAMVEETVGTAEDKAIVHVKESETDPALWKIEVERVAPQLRIQVIADNKDWRTHLETMKAYRESINNALGNTTQELRKKVGEIEKTLEIIATREKYINSQLGSLIEDYKTVQQRLVDTEASYKRKQESVNRLQEQMSAITEELEDVKAKMDSRGSSMNDTSPLVKIKAAIARLKDEIRQMDIRIGITEHALLQATDKRQRSSR